MSETLYLTDVYSFVRTHVLFNESATFEGLRYIIYISVLVQNVHYGIKSISRAESVDNARVYLEDCKDLPLERRSDPILIRFEEIELKNLSIHGKIIFHIFKVSLNNCRFERTVFNGIELEKPRETKYSKGVC